MRSDLVAELGDAELGDARLTKRLGRLVTSLVGAPDRSFPDAAATDSELEGTYRFLNNESVTPEGILTPHVRATVGRAADEGTVVVAHDTTEFSFGKSPRRGLGRVGKGISFGFYGHFALAVSTSEARSALGVVGLTTSTLAELVMNVVNVVEVDAPAGAEPVSWTLWTSEPVETAEQALAVVDYYRRRWVIEEYFKALKTGCAYESRQLESRHALLNALAVFAPIAWRLLSLRTANRTTPELPGAQMLSAVQMRCLRFVMAHVHKRPLPAAPTIAEVTLAIAR